MFEWELLIGLFLYVVTMLFYSLAATYTLDVFMHYGHIFGGVRWKHAMKCVADRPDLQDAVGEIIHGTSWENQVDDAIFLYLKIAATDRRMKLLICPICMGTRISILTCFVFGVAGCLILHIGVLHGLFLIGGTIFFVTPFAVWIISKTF